jgi:tetratricopeptide (TPR) repeat protein
VASAVALYETGARHLAEARGRDPIASDWDLLVWRADCLVNAGWLHYGEAQRLLGEAGLDAARPSLLAAEADFSDAYAALPDDKEARRGLSLTGDLYYQAEDLAGIREHFGRAAKRFDDAEWWNNHAFFCRETERYEDAYAAYSRCIELAPDNARWVNDTGLILLYHLQRDLDHAELLFRRAWELGRAVTDNPFASQEAVQENFLAYTDAMLNLGRLMFEQGRLDEAATVVAELLALAPERPDARQLRNAIERARASDAAPDDVDDPDPEG